MAKTNYTFGKRQRELEKETKRKEKEARRRERASEGGDIPLATIEELQGGDDLMSIEEVMQSMERGPDESVSQRRTVPSRLFVGGLAWGVTTEQLQQAFQAIGPVDDAIVMVDRDTGESRGFGFVTMSDRKDATEAIRKLNGAELEGRTLVVRTATERAR